jgi:hypothetical protein
MKRLALSVIWLLAAGAGCALAQQRSVSYSTWIVSRNMVTLRYLLPVTEAQRLMGVDVPVLTTSKLEDYLLEHESVQSAGGDCPAIDQGFDLGRVDPLAVGPDLYGFEIFFRCTDPRQLMLRNTALFGRVPDHINFARIQMQGWSVEQLFTVQHQQLTLPEGRAPSATGFETYVRLGFVHFLARADRWIFLLGALLLVRGRQDVGYLILALAGGYLLSALVAATGWVLPRMSRMDAFMGLLLALLAALITQGELPGGRSSIMRWPAVLVLLVLVVALIRVPAAAYALVGGAALCAGLLTLSRRLTAPPMLWTGLVALFAFLDGFVLPAVLGPAQLPQRTQVRMVLGFDLGAVLIAALLIGLALGIWRLFQSVRLIVPRAVINDVGAAALYGLGGFWLLTRLA